MSKFTDTAADALNFLGSRKHTIVRGMANAVFVAEMPINPYHGIAQAANTIGQTICNTKTEDANTAKRGLQRVEDSETSTKVGVINMLAETALTICHASAAGLYIAGKFTNNETFIDMGIKANALCSMFNVGNSFINNRKHNQYINAWKKYLSPNKGMA